MNNNKELIKQIITRMSDEEIKAKDVSRVAEISAEFLDLERLNNFTKDEIRKTGNIDTDNSTCMCIFSDEIEKETALYLNQLVIG